MKITCKQAVELIAKEEEGKINFIQKIKLEYHFIVCYVCKYFKIQNTIITKSFANKAKTEHVEMPISDKVAIIKTIEEA